METNIDINKYLGRWYEIAHIPSAFEPELCDVTADYSMNDDGTIKVINAGYTDDKTVSLDGKVSIEGIARKTDNPDILKLSFFKGLESEYRILAIAGDYKYALVGGESPDYLWILGREKYIPMLIYIRFEEIAIERAYNIKKIVLNKN